MTDIELLRKAAALMRERAEAASEGRWAIKPDPGYISPRLVPLGHTVVESVDPSVIFPEDAEHIASWDPTVALAVATLLDVIASAIEFLGPGFGTDPEALSLARAYLRIEEA